MLFALSLFKLQITALRNKWNLKCKLCEYSMLQWIKTSLGESFLKYHTDIKEICSHYVSNKSGFAVFPNYPKFRILFSSNNNSWERITKQAWFGNFLINCNEKQNGKIIALPIVVIVEFVFIILKTHFFPSFLILLKSDEIELEVEEQNLNKESNQTQRKFYQRWITGQWLTNFSYCIILQIIIDYTQNNINSDDCLEKKKCIKTNTCTVFSKMCYVSILQKSALIHHFQGRNQLFFFDLEKWIANKKSG